MSRCECDRSVEELLSESQSKAKTHRGPGKRGGDGSLRVVVLVPPSAKNPSGPGNSQSDAFRTHRHVFPCIHSVSDSSGFVSRVMCGHRSLTHHHSEIHCGARSLRSQASLCPFLSYKPRFARTQRPPCYRVSWVQARLSAWV